MTKTVLVVLCLTLVGLPAIVSTEVYAQNDPNLIPWDENRPLQFGDFQGPPNTFPDDYIGDRGDYFSAYTHTSTYYNWWYKVTQNQPCVYEITAFDINGYFDKSISWVKSEDADMYMLNHEQKHFDMTEIQVRKTNKIVAERFVDKQFACPSFSDQSQDDAINKKISQDLQPIIDQIVQEMAQMTLDYDAQTDHSLDLQKQKEWDDYITNLLEYYEPYKDKQEISLPQGTEVPEFVQPSTTYELAQENKDLALEKTSEEKHEEKQDGGCLIATATYGSELSSQVQFLRELRENAVLSTPSGASFMTAFNALYYSFSPTIADWERQNPLFKETVKVAITPLLSSLSLLQYVDIDSEAEMLGYGISIILLNIGMYFVAPVLIIFKVKSKIS